jgi:stage III sporulation protein AG
MKQNILPGISDFIANIKKHGTLLIIGALALAGLLLLSSFFSDTNNNSPTPSDNTDNNTEEFVKNTENRLKNLLEQIEGIGKCDIMITLESGFEYVYAIENNTNENETYDKNNSSEKTQKSADTEEVYKTIRDGSNEKPIIIKELNPVIRGVAVVCQGGGSTGVKSAIIEMLSTVLGISGDKISISKKYK